MVKRIIPAVFLISSLFLSCPKTEKPYITALLSRDIFEEDTFYYKEIYIYDRNGFSRIPLAQINDTVLPITDFGYHYYLFSEERPFCPGNEYKMTVEHRGGKAEGKVAVPENFSILRPPPNFLLNKDSSLEVLWQKAKSASYYLLSLYLHYLYLDTLGETLSLRISSDTIVNDTTIFYPNTYLFPKNLKRIDWGEGRLNIWAIDGAYIRPGAQGNIQGEGWGFYYAINHAGEIYFRIGSKKGELIFGKDEKRKLWQETKNELLDKLRPRWK